MRTAALIFAGGKSSRFGSDKSLLTFGGEGIVQRLAARCRPLCDEVLILCGEKEKFHLTGIRELPDIVPGRGPLGGLYTGMCGSEAELFLAVACDMPLFDPALAERMLQACGGEYDACAPRNGDRLEPLCAVYRRSALPVIRELLERGENRMGLMLSRIRTRCLERDEWQLRGDGASPGDVFYNINYPSDYARLKDMAAEWTR